MLSSPGPLCLRQERRGWSLAASLLPLPHPCVPGHVAPRCSGRGGFLTWGWGSQGKVGGLGAPRRPGSVGARALPHPTAPGQGGGAVSLRAFWLLGADGQAAGAPCPLCGFAQKRGPAGEGGRLQQVGGWGLAPPPPNPAGMPLGEVCSLGMYLFSGHSGPHSHPQIPRIPFTCGVPPPRQKPHHTPGSVDSPAPLQLQGINLLSLPPPPE